MSNREDLIKRVSERLENLIKSQDSNIIKNTFYSKNLNSGSLPEISPVNLRKTASEILQKDLNNKNLQSLVRDILFPNHNQNYQNNKTLKKDQIQKNNHINYQNTQSYTKSKNSEMYKNSQNEEIHKKAENSEMLKNIKANKIYIPPLDLEKTTFDSQGKKNENLKISQKEENEENIDISDILETYDVKNERVLHNADVYFAIIEIAQKYPDFCKVPSYGDVSEFLEVHYSGKEDISYEEFKDIIKHFK